MVGTGKGARAGILIRSAEALETRTDDTIVLDKTGTITAGKAALLAAGEPPGQGEQDYS